jgi:hypothetical protein
MIEQKAEGLGYLLFMSALLIAVLLATGWFLFAYSAAPDCKRITLKDRPAECLQSEDRSRS